MEKNMNPRPEPGNVFSEQLFGTVGAELRGLRETAYVLSAVGTVVELHGRGRRRCRGGGLWCRLLNGGLLCLHLR